MNTHSVCVLTAGDDMSVFHKIRVVHTILAVLVIAAYFSGDDFKQLHFWLGYGVALLVLFRIGWAALGTRQVGLSKLFPNMTALMKVRNLSHPMVGRALLGAIAISLLIVTGTGIVMHPPAEMIATETASMLAQDSSEERNREGHDEHEVVEEVHETVANLLMILVVLHASYFVAFRRPMALFMLFLRDDAAKKGVQKNA